MNKKIIAVLLMIICIGSIAGGTYSIIPAREYKNDYDTKIETYNTFSKIAENSTKSEYNLTFFTDMMTEKANDLKDDADSAKAELIKFSVLSGVLYFVAVMMLICFIVTIKRINKLPEKEPKMRKKNKKQIETAEEE